MNVLVFGASTKPERYSNIATHMLLEYGHDVALIGGRIGEIQGIPIQTGHPELKDIDIVTLYVGPDRQADHYEYIIELLQKNTNSEGRVIFNPGTENLEFEKRLIEVGIYAQRACTLVLLRTGQFEIKEKSETS